MESQASAEAPQRRKLNLKPRDETAASKAETERKSARSVRRLQCRTNQLMSFAGKESGYEAHAA